MPSALASFTALLLALTLSGCATTASRGLTARAWQTAYENLTVGATPAAVEAALGSPWKVSRENLPPDIDETWIFIRWEETGTRTVLAGEHDIQLPNNQTLSVPDYADETTRDHIAYHLHWRDARLVSWERQTL